MQTIVQRILGLLLRTMLVLMGLVFLFSLLTVATVLLVLWALRALWARLTGRPVQPLAISILRRAQWQRFYRAGSTGGVRADADVIDVESRPVDAGASGRLGP